MTNPSNLLRAFSIDHAARVVKVSKARLTRWDRLGLFSPEYIDEMDRGNPYARVYSYSDLVGLRTLAILVDRFGVSVSEIRKAYEKLRQRWDRPWSEVRLAVVKRQIVFDLDAEPRNVTDGQLVFKAFPLPMVAEEVLADTEKLRSRSEDMIGKFEQKRHVAHNARVIAGTRIPIRIVMDFIDAGYDDDAIVAEYPDLRAADIQAVRSAAKEAA